MRLHLNMPLSIMRSQKVFHTQHGVISHIDETFQHSPHAVSTQGRQLEK